MLNLKMKSKKLNIIILLGLFAIIAILIAQLLWTKEAFTIEEKKFSQKTHIALMEVARKLYLGKNNDLPSENPVEKISNDYYIVNVNNDFEPEILEYYLKQEFKKININTDFEYAMYNCQSDEMVYGNYVSATKNSKTQHSINFPKHKNLVYYFAIRFPTETTYLFSSLKFWFILSFLLSVILIIYSFSIYTILQQKKYSELQRDFINNMTHEFKTPLSSILIASNFLVKQKEIIENEKLKNYSQIIINQSNKLNNHIEKILNLAKSDNNGLELEKTTIAIIPILENAIENIKLKNENAIITIENNLKSQKIGADGFHFSNIIFNILDNSIKYCEKIPTILIKISEDNHQIKMEFIDNGIGISSKNIPFIFDKFYRIPNKKINEINGFGLGLYYVKKICTLHNWKILISNNEISGINCCVLIPKKNV
jgi:two-component system, OmpR family, phosphate regulon sensor histidine kinase PhoR